ncbi:TetR/AcrR family transcriptional regulator [Paenibacillus donghaensis]|uniref:HTH tetR-type domain-containing protein n=1 Tax=Paenibacillus donghaensis TaxID=414771 RepID=A0A2Z2K3T8_9BACL|nr:TetR/AcrR family transcriptional regulator [Paenibacillus donghaensis]ASA20186.1 hypothetical protein B9T62_04855 [Paenibacillus donghaensis]
MDRRIRKNQEAIMNALISLLTEKDFAKITINEIAERANVNRGTVYSHYSDKYDLFDKCLESHFEQLIESCQIVDEQEAYPSKASLLRTFETMEKNALFYRALLTNKGVPPFRAHLQEMMKQGIQTQIMEQNRSLDDLQKDIKLQFLSSATVGVIEWWLTHKSPYSVKDITDELWTLLELNQMIPKPDSLAQKIGQPL